jgi:aspartokinase-like uncharacterized kinase
VLLALNSTLVAASTELEIAERSWQHRAIVWLPSVMVLAEEKIPKTWDVTSDSLAAWLAKRIKAKHLVLVKATEDSSEPNGLLDVAFDGFAADLQCPVTVLGKNEIERFSAIVKPDMERVE